MTTPSLNAPSLKTPAPNTTRFIGVDVHKETLHFNAGDLFRGEVPNTSKDILQTLRALQRKNTGGATLQVCCEATSIYTRPLRDACLKLETPFCILNPFRVRQYGESLGRLAKTDKADAETIRLYAEAAKPKPLAPPDATRERLRQTHDMRDACVEAKTQLSNSLAAVTLPAYRRDIQTMLRSLEARIAKYEALLAQVMREAEPELAGLVKALDAIKGVGFLTATKLLAHCPELGTLTRRGGASLAGLAPYPKDSANASSPRHIRGGRKPVRDALYMAAGVAAQHNEVLKVFYQRLRAAGKCHNVAVTAVMRKLFHYANVVAGEYLRSLAAPAPKTAPASSTSATAD